MKLLSHQQIQGIKQHDCDKYVLKKHISLADVASCECQVFDSRQNMASSSGNNKTEQAFMFAVIEYLTQKL